MKERGLHILEALDNLNTLVDADSLAQIEVTPDSLLIGHKGGEEIRDVYWVQAGADDQTLGAVKDTFKAVHAYLRHFYTNKKKVGDAKRLIEGINTIMVLVGEAAKNLEKLSNVYRNKITEFEEYKKLQNFYRNRVIREAFNEFAKTPIINKKAEKISVEEQLEDLFEEEEIVESAGVHLLNDLDLIKRDHLYDLFYLKNEAGHNFYTYDLARSIKLGCDFGEFSKEYFSEDPLLQIKNWEDKSLNLSANYILKNCSRMIEKFLSQSFKYKKMPLVCSVMNAVMALMLAANPRNLIRQFSYKGCHLYFHDFLLFLRATLENREYQKFLIYSPPLGQPFFQDMIDCVDALSYHLFTMPAQYGELSNALKQMIERKGGYKKGKLSDFLSAANSALNEVLKMHPNGPLFKAVDIIREENEKHYDPLAQGNSAAHEWSLRMDNALIKVLRMPCPITQEVINRAFIAQEFKTFLRSLRRDKRLLYIDYQDKTSWKEHARSLAIEDLARQAEFAENFILVILAKDTDFYNQTGLYKDADDARIFIDQLYQHLEDEMTGYYFPLQFKKELFPKFISPLLAKIHTVLFANKSAITFLERLDFIEIAYHFIELKLIELVQPSFLCLSSKDGLDVSATASLGLVTLLSLSQNRVWDEKELENLVAILFGPTLMHRERAIHPERFGRLISVIELLEGKGKYLNEFAPLYNKETLRAQIDI